jgi:hypothetical protein
MMQLQANPLEPLFHDAVRNSYEGRLGLDSAITAYVSRMLCDFSEPDNLYRLRDVKGRPIEGLQEMIRAADPVYGTAKSFIQERTIRRYIGDYALFLAGSGRARFQPVIWPALARRTHSHRQGELLHRQPVQRIRIRAGSSVFRAPFKRL